MTPLTSNLARSLVSTLAATWLALAAPASASPEPAGCPPEARMPTPEELQAATERPRDRGFLWKIRKDGRTSYLYGTMHVAKIDWMFPGPKVLDAVRASDVVALEIDMVDPAMLERVRAGMLPRADRTLPAKLAERLRVQATAACVPPTLPETMTPEMLGASLVLLSARREGLDPAYGIDGVLAGIGHGAQKTVVSLETPESQLELLQGRTQQETELIVGQALDELENGKASRLMGRIATVWAEGRLSELEHYDRWCECLETALDRERSARMLDGRNPGMASRIDEIHASGQSVFAAVGSLHMIGKTGLPALLAKRGYRVERIPLGP